MIELIKKILYGTPLEKQARKLGGLYHYLKYPKIRMGRTYDKQTVAAMKLQLKAGSNCIDIGCHQGFFLQYMRRYAPQGRHFAFEPIPHLADTLKKNFPDVSVFPVALSNTRGKATFFHVVNNPAYSGLERRPLGGAVNEVMEIDVPVERLDDIVPQDLKFDFLKIDTEGAELDVLRGARQLIQRSRPLVVFEFEQEAAEKYGATPEQVYDLFDQELNMHVSLLSNWLKNKAAFSRTEFAQQYYRQINFYFIAYPKNA